jgi:biotin carboxylase
VIAARVCEAVGLAGHPPAAAATARNKQLTRERLSAAGMPTPWFRKLAVDADAPRIADSVSFPCVVKPVALSGSRGVIRADDAETLVSALGRLRALLRSPDIRAERDSAHSVVLVEEFIPGREYAVEAVMHHGDTRVLAVFDKPDPLDGPFFEETIYVTPSREPRHVQDAIEEAVARAASAIGLQHGPVHAECRVNENGVYVLEVAARPIGGLCARALRMADGIPFEEALLRHALGESPDAWVREADASGVMMMPIPARGVFRGVEGLDEARGVEYVDDVRVTAKPDQVLVPLPEGGSYLGFIFARAPEPTHVERALRTAHGRLRFTIEPELQVLQSRHG